MGGFFRFARKHIVTLLGLINIAVAIGAVQVVAARSGALPVLATGRAENGSGKYAAVVSPGTRPAPPAPASPLPEHRQPPRRVVAAMPIAGKGMWIWLFPQVGGGDPSRIVREARRMGLTHLYVRSSSTTSGFKYLRDIDRIVPVAHAAGLKIIAWDFPRLVDPNADADRIARVISHVTPGGGRVDGVAADLETASEGVKLTAARAMQFSRRLAQLRPDAFRVLVPPRPSPAMQRHYPYQIIRYYNAVAPMVYWITRDPLATVHATIMYLRRFHKPVAPVGQAYDASIDGGPKLQPTGRTLEAFARQARKDGAVGISFWSWQHATWDELRGIARIAFPATP